MQIRVPYTAYLVALVAEASTAAGRLIDLPPDRRAALAAQSRRDVARYSARLDGSPLDDATAAAVDDGTWTPPADVVAIQHVGGWAEALRLDGMATSDVAGVEYSNLLAADDLQPELAQDFFDRPLEALGELHAAICRGLVDAEVAGRFRTTAQAVHDGAQGRVIFNAPDPLAVPDLMAELQAWLRGDGQEGSAAYPAPVAAAIVHELVLQWQPYEAANGRVARAAARLILRARGMDPHGLAVPERWWAADPGGYYAEVAATMRRRGDLGPWAERSVEALAAALHEAADSVHAVAPGPPSPRAVSAAEQLAPGQSITVAEYAVAHAVSRETAWRDLRALAAGGLVAREPKSLGRQFRKL